MLINFMEEEFLPRICCDKVSCDHYEVTNLTSRQNRGFLAESFIKPPVTITVRFPFNVNIERIVINGKIGSQHSTGFEVCTASLQRKVSWLISDVPNDGLETYNERAFLKIGRGYEINRNIFTFVNNRFRREPNVTRDPDPLVEATFPLNHHYDKHLSGVSSVAVRVTSTRNGSAIAVRAIEIWGKPAAGVPAEVLKRLNLVQSMKDSKNHFPDGHSLSAAVNISKSLQGNVATNVVPDVEIPAEFLDAITHCLMSFPVILPSGQTIDQTTLDRYIKEEEIWGRAPSDPFTGKAFTTLHRPVQNTPLKVRLDEFLLKRGTDFQTRTDAVNYGIVGRGGGFDQRCSRLVEATKRGLADHDPDNVDSQNFTGQVQKRIKLTSNQGSKLPSQSVTCLDNSDSFRSSFVSDMMGRKDKTTANVDSAPGTSLSILPSIAMEHKDKISASLDSELRTTLSLLPSFTKNQGKGANLSKGIERSPMIGCCSCGSLTVEQMYRLKCAHNICRQCLLNAMKVQNQSKCKTCDRSFCFHDVTKIHLSKSDFLI